jgi:hypothetical protein
VVLVVVVMVIVVHVDEGSGEDLEKLNQHVRRHFTFQPFCKQRSQWKRLAEGRHSHFICMYQ